MTGLVAASCGYSRRLLPSEADLVPVRCCCSILEGEELLLRTRNRDEEEADLAIAIDKPLPFKLKQQPQQTSFLLLLSDNNNYEMASL